MGKKTEATLANANDEVGILDKPSAITFVCAHGFDLLQAHSYGAQRLTRFHRPAVSRCVLRQES